MDPTLSPFLTLPPELRNQILETLFFGAQLSTICKHHRRNPFQRANYGILSANKQVHREASNILFHGAVLRLDMVRESMDHLPSFVTKTVIPVWSWFVRDRYLDNGIGLDYLQRWQGLSRVRHVEMSLLSGKSRIRWIPGLTREATWQYAQAGEKGYLSGFLNVLPDLESLTIDTDADRPPWMEKKLREMTSAKIVILETGDSCGYQP